MQELLPNGLRGSYPPEVRLEEMLFALRFPRTQFLDRDRGGEARRNMIHRPEPDTRSGPDCRPEFASLAKRLAGKWSRKTQAFPVPFANPVRYPRPTLQTADCNRVRVDQRAIDYLARGVDVLRHTSHLHDARIMTSVHRVAGGSRTGTQPLRSPADAALFAMEQFPCGRVAI
jgi:hypothetical protein